MRTILICLSCQLPINLEKYEQLCHTTGQNIVDKYPWLPMTATVHKILVHSKDILEQTVFPVGYFGEEAAESRNTIYQLDRHHHARKHNRICSFADLVQRAMDTSDSIISSINLKGRIRKQNRLPLPPEVIQMLAYEFEPDNDSLDSADCDEEVLYNIKMEN